MPLIAIFKTVGRTLAAKFSPTIRGMKPIMAILVIAVTIPLMSACGGGSNLFTPLDERIYSEQECKDQEDIEKYCSQGYGSHVPPVIHGQLYVNCLDIHRYRYSVGRACQKQKERRENPAVGFKCETNPQCILDYYNEINIAGAVYKETNQATTRQIRNKINAGASIKIQQMLNAGADVNAKNNNGHTPLRWAIILGNTEVIPVLVKAGANVNARDNLGVTPLHNAALNGDKRIIYILLNAGADVNAKVNNGVTPLHIAAGAGNTEVIPVLVKAGANVNARSAIDVTPLDGAKLKGELNSINELKKHGGKCNTTC